MITRRKLFAGLLAAPIAAAASCVEPEPKPSPRKVTRIVTVPHTLSMAAAERLARTFQEAVDSGKVVILEDGATYQEFYGEPGPVRIQKKTKGAESVGTLTVNVEANTEQFEDRMARIKQQLQEIIELKQEAELA